MSNNGKRVASNYGKEIVEQVIDRYKWLKSKGNFSFKNDNGERTPEYHNLGHLETELNMCERIILRTFGKDKFNEMVAFVCETYRRLES